MVTKEFKPNGGGGGGNKVEDEDERREVREAWKKGPVPLLSRRIRLESRKTLVK